jgi:cytochrome c oxidase subunit 4
MQSHNQHQDKPHPSLKLYLGIGAILTIVTLIEVLVFYLSIPGGILVSLFIVLSLAKFALVVLFFMHLRYDHRIFGTLFTGSLLLAMGIGVAFLTLFGNFDIGDPNVAAISPTPTPHSLMLAGPSSAQPPNNGQYDGPVTGAEVFINKGCGGCHIVEGMAGAVGVVGPGLNGLLDRASQRLVGYTSQEYIRESIENPSAYVVEGFAAVMPELRGQMTNEEFEALVEFLIELD